MHHGGQSFGDDTDHNALDEAMLAGASGSAAATAAVTSACSTPGRPAAYKPGLHGQASRKRSRHIVLDSDSESDEHGSDSDHHTPVTPTEQPSVRTAVGKNEATKKTKKTKRKAAGESSISDAVTKLCNTQVQLQHNQQTFLAGVMRQQQDHTQALIQSQMKFTADLFKKCTSDD
eukprot:scpid71341/ scgid12785/ 